MDADQCNDNDNVCKACQPPPSTSNGHIDWSMPCWAARAISVQCSYGPEGLELFEKAQQNPGELTFGRGWWPQPPDVERACMCSSQFAEMALGCATCWEKHGADAEYIHDQALTANATAMDEMMALYCDVDLTPTEDSQNDAMDEVLQDGGVLGESETSATFDDPIGTSTDVSFYFTPSVTGSSAYVVAMPTANSTSGREHSNAWYTYTSLSISDGQIVPTAAAKANEENDEDSGAGANGNSNSEGDTTTAAAGAVQTAMAYPGVGVGALGFVMMAVA